MFIYGPVAAGKLAVGRELATLTGLPLFHNHLIVDAVGAVFPFGTEPFIRLREGFWLQTFSEAARLGHNPSRSEFGKLRSVDLLRSLREQFDACMAAMPVVDLSIDTERCDPRGAAEQIAELLSAGR